MESDKSTDLESDQLSSKPFDREMKRRTRWNIKEAPHQNMEKPLGPPQTASITESTDLSTEKATESPIAAQINAVFCREFGLERAQARKNQKRRTSCAADLSLPVISKILKEKLPTLKHISLRAIDHVELGGDCCRMDFELHFDAGDGNDSLEIWQCGDSCGATNILAAHIGGHDAPKFLKGNDVGDYGFGIGNAISFSKESIYCDIDFPTLPAPDAPADHVIEAARALDTHFKDGSIQYRELEKPNGIMVSKQPFMVPQGSIFCLNVRNSSQNVLDFGMAIPGNAMVLGEKDIYGEEGIRKDCVGRFMDGDDKSIIAYGLYAIDEGVSDVDLVLRHKVNHSITRIHAEVIVTEEIEDPEEVEESKKYALWE